MPLTRAQKEDQLAVIEAQLDQATTLYLTDPVGLSVAEVTRLRRAFPRRIRLRRGLYRAGPRSRLLVGTRRGKIAFVAVASRGVLKKSRTVRGYLRLAGVRR